MAMPRPFGGLGGTRRRPASRLGLLCRRGMVTLEFGLIAASLIIVLAGALDFARFLATRTALRAAVGEVVRAAMTSSSLTGCTTPETYAISKVAMLAANDLTVCVTRGTNSLTVTASYSFAFVIPILGTAPRTINASTTTPVLGALVAP
jgi:Flp pilus assembly protein TadG